MSGAEIEGYYAARSGRLLRGWELAAPRIHRALESHYGSKTADSIVADTRVEFERIIPDIPTSEVGATR